MSNTCGSCGAKIVWGKTKAGKSMPIDMFTLPESDKVMLIDRWNRGDNTPLIFNAEKHISHFATCPNAKQHRKKKNDSKKNTDKRERASTDDSGIPF